MQANNNYQINVAALESIIPKMFNDLKALQVQKNWEKDEDKPCQTFFRESDKGMIVKGTKIINFSIQQILQFVSNEQNFKKINEQCVQHKILFKNQQKFKIAYSQMKLPWPMDNRQTIMLFTRVTQNQNKVYLINKTVQFPYPQTKGVIRAENVIGGFVLQRVGQKQTRMTTYGHFDPKGSILQIIKKQVSKKRAQVPAKIQQKMKQFYGK